MESKKMSRGKYWIGMLIYFVCCTIVSVLIEAFTLRATGNLTAYGWSVLIAWVVLSYIFKVMLAEPRVRDYSGESKYTWLVFIPLISTIYVICIGCYRSKKIEEK